MNSNLSLNRLAIHHIDKRKNEPTYAGAEKEIAVLHPGIGQFFLEMSSELWDVANSGKTQSARFVGNRCPNTKPSVARDFIEQIIDDPSTFFESSKKLARLLHEITPLQAQSGLLAILRMQSVEIEKAFVIILKMHHNDESLIRVLSDVLTPLEVGIVRNMLPRGIQKGACIPHPHSDDYDLLLFDKQSPNVPAKYFTDGFLGCVTQKSGVYQIKHLIPTLARYAREEGLQIESEKIPKVIESLQERESDINSNILLEVVQEQGIYGQPIDPEDFYWFIEQESNLGPIDIPKEAFSARRVTYKFRDPRLRGVSLNGPPEVLSSLTSVEGDKVTVVIRTTGNGYTVHF